MCDSQRSEGEGVITAYQFINAPGWPYLDSVTFISSYHSCHPDISLFDLNLYFKILYKTV